MSDDSTYYLVLNLLYGILNIMLEYTLDIIHGITL